MVEIKIIFAIFAMILPYNEDDYLREERATVKKCMRSLLRAYLRILEIFSQYRIIRFCIFKIHNIISISYFNLFIIIICGWVFISIILIINVEIKLSVVLSYKI